MNDKAKTQQRRMKNPHACRRSKKAKTKEKRQIAKRYSEKNNRNSLCLEVNMHELGSQTTKENGKLTRLPNN